MMLTCKATRSLRTNRGQKQTPGFFPVGSALDECPVCVLANIENIFSRVEFYNDSGLRVRSDGAEDTRRPVHGGFAPIGRRVKRSAEEGIIYTASTSTFQTG